MDFFDTASGLVVVLGMLLTAFLIVRYVRVYRRIPARWAFRAVVMLITVFIVWLGSAATLLGKVDVIPAEVAQFFALGSRLTLAALLIWLVLLPLIPDDHPVPTEPLPGEAVKR